jgi:hypothetical protein
MTITYNWSISGLERETSDGYVYLAHWAVEALESSNEADDETPYSANCYGTLSLPRPDNLIPYESLSEEMVLGWVKEKFSEEEESGMSKLQQIEQGLFDKIQQQKHPTRAFDSPW